ncbi:DUF2817 domain-containing protein [Candidatus Saccharibacteria bacterium TM7i]|nr:DUF2817 domain-containing protein [Candidatus Saccharibacteria bacterium TM7i]
MVKKNARNRPKINTTKKYTWPLLIGALTLGVAVYGFIFLIPKSMTLAYADDTCVSQLTILPGIHKYSADTYTLRVEGVVKAGELPLVATTLCATPKTAPTPGNATVAVAPFNGWLFKKSFIITAPELPKMQSATLADKPVSAALPLSIPLSTKDTLHTYQLSVANKSTPCHNSDKDSSLSCDVAQLHLAPGTEYSAKLTRSYNEKDTTTLITDDLKTLLPLTLQKADIETDQTIYTTPEGTSFTFDKPLKEADATLSKKDSSDTIKIQTLTEGATLRIQFPEKMERKTTYTLAIHQAVSEDGSSLAEPIMRTFTLSGGPKVTGISIGANNIPQSGTATITFDQPIHESIDIAKFISIKGVPGVIKRTGATTASVTLQSAPLCAPFTITVAKGMKSGSNEEVADTDWRHDGRIICGTSAVIGYSVKGRPIVAYYFGSGATTILFTGAIHGNETSAYSTMTGWVNHLQVNAHKIPAGKRVVIVPNMSPDGITSGARNNANNVNLGRNFPTANWKADIETANGVLKNGGGTSALSEPEARALANLTRQLRPRIEISFHAQGRLVGANKFGDSVRIGDIYANTVGYRTMYTNAEAVMGYPMTGEYEDWMGESMGLPAILVELPSHSGNYVQSQLTALWKMVTI